MQKYSETGGMLRLTNTQLDWAAVIFSAITAVTLAATNLYHRSDFFLHDDFGTYFMPLFGEISRLVRHGEVPFVTDRVWPGGAILSEYWTGLLNPVCLLLITLTGAMTNHAAAAAIYALIHIAIFAAGTFFLCRVLNCGRKQAFLAAVVAPTSEWIIYWGASNWIAFLVAMAWMPWAWAAILKSASDARWRVLAAGGVYMVITAGATYADLALLISVLSAAIAVGAWAPNSVRKIAAPATAIISGGLLALPSVLPLLFYNAIAGGMPEEHAFQADLVALFGAGMPFMLTRWKAFEPGYQIIFLPMIGVAWYIFPAIANASWKRLWLRTDVRAIVFTLIVLGLLSMTPQLLQFRWMFRLLPFYQFGLVILSAIALSDLGGDRRPWNGWITAACIGFPIWVSIWEVPALAEVYILLGLCITAIALLAWRQRRLGVEGFTAIATGGHVILFVAVGAIYAAMSNRFPNNWPPLTVRPPSDEAALTRFEIFDIPRTDPSQAYWLYYRPGNTNLERPGISINGYSRFFWLSAYEHGLCFAHLGAIACGDIVNRLLAPITPTSTPRLDLMRVDEVRISDPSIALAFRNKVRGWANVSNTSLGSIFRRNTSYILPAPISWVSKGTTVAVTRETPSDISMNIKNPTSSGATIVLARAWYPGWAATLGSHELSVHTPDGILTVVDLPPKSVGRLEVSYSPAGLGLGLCGALIGFILLVATPLSQWLLSKWSFVRKVFLSQNGVVRD